MKIDEMTKSLILYALGTFVYAFSVGLLTALVVPVSSYSSLAVPSSGFQLLQNEDIHWAIVGVAIGAALAIGIPGIGASFGMATASAAALGAITERPELFGKSVLYVVFIEAIAIYGFVIAFLLSGYIPSLIELYGI